MSHHKINYVTQSAFKREEIATASSMCEIEVPEKGKLLIGKVFNFDFVEIDTYEPLECDLKKMVRHKAKAAYREILTPCIVEHAGLIFDDYKNDSFPGGLTQPMWDALGAERFISELNAAGRLVTARAVIGYCDGLNITVFQGETEGRIADRPRGSREFYWDTIFCPNEYSELTYAEICEEEGLGVPKKIEISQSIRALRKFLEHYLDHNDNWFFAGE